MYGKGNNIYGGYDRPTEGLTIEGLTIEGLAVHAWMANSIGRYRWSWSPSSLGSWSRRPVKRAWWWPWRAWPHAD